MISIHVLTYCQADRLSLLPVISYDSDFIIKI